jgi:Cu+-exporting ATPase
VITERLSISGMSCAACTLHVQRALEAVPGVTQARVNLLNHTADVTTAAGAVPRDHLLTAVEQAGYRASIEGHTAEGHTSAQTKTVSDTLGLRAALALIAGVAAMLLSMPLMSATATTDPLLAFLARRLMPLEPATLQHLPAAPVAWFLAALTLATMIFAAPEIYTAAFRAARHRATNMNTLVALGTLAAFASSLAATAAPRWLAARNIHFDLYYEAAILILAFLLLGRWLEARARHQATASLRGFAQLEAPHARFLAAAADNPPDLLTAPETVLPLDAVEPGDLLRVLPGDRIPVDAVILHGQSSLDESMLTGEPLPITRSPGDPVSAGTLNLDGPLILRATATGAHSTLAQMRRLLDQAQSGRAPLQRLADRASAIFVPSVLALSALTFLAWSLLGNTHGHHAGFGLALTLAIAVLIVACPCAMGLAIPAAIAVAIGRAAQLGLLIKGPEAIERLASITTVALDKTGTLTSGKPHVLAFHRTPTATFDDPTLLAWLYAVERNSTHPLAAALTAFSGPSGIAATSDIAATAIQTLPGIGLRATVDGHTLTIGNNTLLATPPAPTTDTPVHILVDGVHQATLLLTDTLRPEASAAISTLHSLRLTTTLLTGDTLAAAAPIARAAGITGIHAHLLPAQKLEAIRQLQSAHKKVAMVGDGINDAAALAQSDAGLAMAHGADLAREAGDVLLLRPDLRLIPSAIVTARRTLRIMRQNLFWALAYNALALPIAAGVLYPHFHILLSPVLASAAMALSSVSVLLNSLRLRRLCYQPSPVIT